jgi:hypothetical protein
MSEMVRVTRLQRRCYFRTEDSLRRALSESYIADVVMTSDSGELTLRSIPAALFLLDLVAECALSKLASNRHTMWVIPETDAELLISALDDTLTVKPLFEGDWVTQDPSFIVPVGRAINLFYNGLCELIIPDRDDFERLSPFVADNPIIRRIFDIRYS